MSDAIELRFTIEGNPQPKQRARRGKGGHHYTPDETRRYETRVRETAVLAAMDAGLPRREPQASGVSGKCRVHYLTRPLRVDAHIFWPDARRRDGDNVYKSILDGMQPARSRGFRVGLGLIEDDDLVHEHHVYEAIDRERPRVEIVVSVMETE